MGRLSTFVRSQHDDDCWYEYFNFSCELYLRQGVREWFLHAWETVLGVKCPGKLYTPFEFGRFPAVIFTSNTAFSLYSCAKEASERRSDCNSVYREILGPLLPGSLFGLYISNPFCRLLKHP